MPKFSIKYLETKFSSTFKRPHGMVKLISFQMQVWFNANKFYTAYKWNQGQKSQDYLN
jgi:hypothetical protein